MWYRKKVQEIMSHARSMLSGGPGPENNAADRLVDNETNLMIPSSLVNMERQDGETRQYNIKFMTVRIAEIVADVQGERNWNNNWQTLNLFFHNSETRVAAGVQFQKMFLRKFQKQNPNTLPPCYELGKTPGMHLQSPVIKSAAMPWRDIGQQPTLRWISIGKDVDGDLYSKKELREVMKMVVRKDNPPICFLIPCAKNWASWDAALFLRLEDEEKREEIHIVFLQITIQPDHKIYTKGLNQVRDVIPRELSVHYHYVLVLLINDDAVEDIHVPKWRHVLLNSNEKTKDASWRYDNLKQYIMCIPMTELRKL